jgi:prepilin-type N-terminal cleavage/methylation domain-containing protein
MHNILNKDILKSTNKQKGFSLPELIIVIAIFSIVTSVAMFNQSKLNGSTLLTNMAYEVGLAIREAQTYGISVRSGDSIGNFSGQYGAYFNTSTETSRRQVIVFADGSIPGNKADYMYDTGEERYVYEFESGKGNKISAICTGDLSGNACTDGIPGISESSVAVLFKSPNPSALVSPVIEGQDARLTPVYIVVSSADGDDCRVVIVEPTGQVRVEDASKGSCAKITP